MTPATFPHQRSFGTVIAAALVITGAALLWGLLDRQNAQPYTAPDFTLNVYGGQPLRLADLRGKVVVINFWADWCVPCRAEAPTLQAVWLQNKDHGVVFLGVDQSGTVEKTQAYLHEYGITYANGPDTGIASAYRIQGLPTTIIVNREGIVTDTILAAVNAVDLQARIDQAIR